MPKIANKTNDKVQIKGAFRLDAKQREAKVGDLRQPSRLVDYVTREGCQPSRVFASGC